MDRLIQQSVFICTFAPQKKLMRFIDTHTHNYDEAYGQDRDEVILRSAAAGVDILIQPDVDSKERDRMFSLVEKYPGRLFPMLGLYPGSVDGNWRDEYERMLNYTDRKIVAIGEIGLDYHYGAEYAKEQQEAFILQLELAARLNLPVNIHLREATEDFFRILDQNRHLGLRGNLHAFSGSYETFKRIEKYGEWYVGIGGVLTFKNSKMAESVQKIPLDRIVLETDSPYLTPTPHRGTRNESAYIPIIAARLAEIKGISIEETAETTTNNARVLFNL